jgi:putative ABC transport system permease protein
MFANYFKVALRKIIRQKFYAFINILGLSIGLATCLLISSFVIDELSYDRHHEQGEQIYRMSGHVVMGGQENHFTTVPAPMGIMLQENLPEIISMVRFRRNGAVNTYLHDQIHKIKNVVYADSSVFDVFTIPMLYGNPANALKETGSLVISTRQAEIFFGPDWKNESVVGKMVQVGTSKENYTISGVYEAMPDNSHFHFDMMISMSAQKESQADMWLNNNFSTYLLVREGTRITQLKEKINQSFETYAAPQLKQYANTSLEEFYQVGNRIYYDLMPISDIHLHSDLVGEFEPNGKMSYVFLFGIIAFFVLLIACVNFMNLSTARSAERAREVGIRKAVGSFRRQLIAQFMTEAILMSMIAGILSLLLAEIALPYFNSISGKSLSLNYLLQLRFLPIALFLILLVGVLAGSYPAFFLSAYRPVEVLKGKLSSGGGGAGLRSTLVVLQFGISFVLMVSTLVVYRQLEHLSHMELGYDKEHVLVLHNTDFLEGGVDAFKTEMLRHPDILQGTITAYVPASSFEFNSSAVFRGKNPNDEHTASVNWFAVDYDYLETMGIELAEGRNFSREYSTDTAAIIVNEAFVKNYELSKDNKSPVGTILSTFSRDGSDYISFKLIGVVKNFHFQTVRDKISPMVMVLNHKNSFVGRSTFATSFRIAPGKSEEVLSFLEAAWKDQAPDMPFEYSFMDERYDRLYRSEQKLGLIFTAFCILALFVASLGLFGLSSYMAEQRTKEIGIRKVLGATSMQIIVLLTRDFTRLVLVSILIALPVAYFAAYQWLEDFAYRISLDARIFVLSAILAVAIAWLTVSYQSLRAAVMNPALSIKNE